MPWKKCHRHCLINKKGWQITAQTVHPAASEVLRDPCDVGTQLEKVQTEFPAWDWSLMQQQQQQQSKSYYWWGTGQYNVQESWHMMRHDLPGGRESHANVHTRLQTLRQYISTRVTADICVVVCHSETIWWLSSARGVNGNLYGIWTQNGEMVDLTEQILGADMVVAEDATETASSINSSLYDGDDEDSRGSAVNTGSNGGSTSGLDERYEPFEVFLT